MARTIIYDAKYWFVVLSENQYYLGRSFILFKGEKTSLSELTREEFLNLKLVIDLMEDAMKSAFNATYFNWTCLMNDHYDESLSTKRTYLHLHLWPRYKHPITLNGEEFIDETFGDYSDRTKVKNVSDELFAEIAKLIKVHINA